MFDGLVEVALAPEDHETVLVLMHAMAVSAHMTVVFRMLPPLVRDIVLTHDIAELVADPPENVERAVYHGHLGEFSGIGPPGGRHARIRRIEGTLSCGNRSAGCFHSRFDDS